MTSEKDHNIYMLLRKLSMFLAVSLLVISFGLRAGAQTVMSRPKVGLALSGGGALGMAHIGVLKVMEGRAPP